MNDKEEIRLYKELVYTKQLEIFKLNRDVIDLKEQLYKAVNNDNRHR